MKHELILEGLNCAHCAAKIEDKLSKTPGYHDVKFAFATKELEITCDKDDIRDEVQQLVDSIEDGVTVLHAHEAHHTVHAQSHGDHDECCGHEHHEEHQHEHSHGEEHSKLKLILLCAGAVLFIVAFILHFLPNTAITCAVLSILATALSGYDVAIKGVRSVLKRRIDETTLMTVAVLAAMVLGEFVEAAAVMVLFGVGELLEDKAVEKSRRDIRKLADIRPDKATLLEGGVRREVMAEQVAVGSLIEIAPHTRVPLDGVVTEGHTTLDASSLTGESAPVSAGPGSELMSGMLNNDSTVVMQTTKAYADSAATRIVKLVEESAKNKGSGEKLISRFAAIYTPVMISLALVIAILPSLITGEWAAWIHRALVCLVASCPCSIVISVPLSYFAGIGAASKAGVLIKGGRFVEALSTSKCFAFDKTGTLTNHHISVEEIKSLSDYSVEEIIQLAVSAEARSTHPIADAIREYCEEYQISILELKDYTEIPGIGVSAMRGEDHILCGKDESRNGITVKVNGEAIGMITVTERVRPEAPQVLRELHRLGVERLAMLSGDRREACEKAADKLHITQIYSELLPEDKVDRVERLIRSHGSCCFVGDGINDAPVLSRSSCGIAMGLGSEAAIESADMVLSAETLDALPHAVRIARTTMRTVKANIAFSLLVKALIIVLAILDIAPLWLAVFADTGVCLLCVLNAVRLIRKK